MYRRLTGLSDTCCVGYAFDRLGFLQFEQLCRCLSPGAGGVGRGSVRGAATGRPEMGKLGEL
jgi:hypothetical protein